MTLDSKSGLPLDGVRIADLTHVWAGPKCTQILADLGAQVIKVEAPRRADPARGITGLLGLERYPGRERGTRPQNRSGYFNLTNRNKYGIAIDLNDPRGLDLFKALVSVSDAVIDNFSAGVTQRLGLAYEDLRKVKEDIIVLSMSGFGGQGPDSRYIAWADTVEALAGIPAITGYRGDPPMANLQAPSDPLNGVMAAAAVLVALHARRETGLGQYIDLSQSEVMVTMNAPSLLDFAMNGRTYGPNGNRARDMAPHGTYPCAGEDRWVAIAVSSDAEWRRLAGAMGAADLGDDRRFATVTVRLQNIEELERIISAWTSPRDALVVTEQLQAIGISCGPVLDSGQLLHDPHLRARGLFQELPHAEVGPYPYYIGARPRLPEINQPVRKPAPLFGEDTDLVLRDILGLGDAQIAELELAGVVSRELLQAVYVP